MTRKTALNRKTLVVAALLLFGAILIYMGLATPYPIRDMNGDGAIDWRDYDVNGDGVVEGRDITTVCRAYGSIIGDERYNSRLDFNGDGVVDDYDVNAIKNYFGQGSLSIIDLMAYRATTPKGMQAILGFACIIAAVIVWFKWTVKR